MRKRQFHRTLTAAIVVPTAAAASLLLAVSAASAATNSTSAPPSQSSLAVKTTLAMHKIRVTRLLSDTPDKTGRVRVELANGAIIPIPETIKNKVMDRAAQEAKNSPDTTVTGNCGTSSVNLAEKSDQHPVRMTTGFTVDDLAVAYGWAVQITGPSYSFTYTASGTLDFDTGWSGSYDSPEDQLAGTYTASVIPDDSFAVLWTGDVCFSLGPVATKKLTSPDTPISMPLSTNGPISQATPTIGSSVSPQAAKSGAIDASPGFAGEPAPQTQASSDPLTRVSNTTVYPYRAITRLNITYLNGSSEHCTGFLYAPNIVATAGHCLYFPGVGWAAKVQVVPGNNVDSAGKQIMPFGSCMGTTAFTTLGWFNNGPTSFGRMYDYGAVKLDCNIGLQVGYFGLFWTTAPLTGTSVTITGYPVSQAPTGSMWTNSGTIALSEDRQLFYNIFTGEGGDSGAPVYMPGCETYCAIAINAYGAGGGLPPGATRITQPAFNNYQTWKA